VAGESIVSTCSQFNAQCPINIDELIACAAGEDVVRWAHVSRPSRDDVESRVWLS
jgi:hypothetical protein